MICEQQKTASGLDAVNPLSPPPTPGHKGKSFPSNFLTTSQENFCSTSALTTVTNTTTHGTIHAIDTGSAVTPTDAADLQFNFNIPRFISTELKPSQTTHQAKDSQNSHLSLTLPNHWQELHSSTSQSLSHSYPSPVSSPEESEQSIQALLEASAALQSPVSSSLHQQQSQEEQSYFHQHHHHHHRNHHHLNRLNTFPTDTPQKHSEELPSIFNFVKSKEKGLFLDIPTSITASDVDHTTHHQFSFNNPNSNNCNSNSSKVIESDARDIVTTQVNTTRYPYHKELGQKRLNFDMSRTDVTTDINNNNNSSHNFHTAATTKNNNNTHDYTQEMDNVFLPWTFLMSSCEEPVSNISASDQSDFFAHMDARTHQLPPFSELNAIMSDVHMTDSGSSTECDITDLKDVADMYEWEQFSDIMNSAASYTSELLSITDFCSTDSTGSTSGDDFSEGDYKDSQHLQLLEVSSNFPNLLFNNPSHPGDSDRPQSPSTSDEGFVDCVPTVEKDLPLGGKKLPFDGKFPETEDSEASSTTADSKKRARKRPSPLKLKRKTVPSPPGERRKPGRKPGQVSNVLHLWEFMRDLLHDPRFNGCIIEWISQIEGVFRVLDSAAVARLWGEKKNNKKAMTYEKLSRSLRYSRLEGYFANLPKDKNYPKKLCFKFGPKSKNWSLKL